MLYGQVTVRVGCLQIGDAENSHATPIARAGAQLFTLAFRRRCGHNSLRDTDDPNVFLRQIGVLMRKRGCHHESE